MVSKIFDWKLPLFVNIFILFHLGCKLKDKVGTNPLVTIGNIIGKKDMILLNYSNSKNMSVISNYLRYSNMLLWTGCQFLKHVCVFVCAYFKFTHSLRPIAYFTNMYAKVFSVNYDFFVCAVCRDPIS